jgi:hypothetical protein
MRFFDKLLNYAKLIWKDSVGSKVISMVLIGVFVWAAYFLRDSYSVSVPLWLLIAVSVPLCISNIIFLVLWRAEKGRGQDQTAYLRPEPEPEVENIKWAKGRILPFLFRANENNELERTLLPDGEKLYTLTHRAKRYVIENRLMLEHQISDFEEAQKATNDVQIRSLSD